MKKKRNSKGFTLIEVIIALAILGIIVASFLTMFSSGYISVFSMGNKTQAMALAQEIIDTGDFSDLRDFSADCAGMLNTPYDSSVDDIGRYCIDQGTIQISYDSVGAKEYSTVTVMIFYGTRREHVR